MPNTYHQLYIQTVFPVKYRRAQIHPDWKTDLQAVLGKLINNTGCKTLIVNGMEDHMHCFFGLKPSISVSDVIKSAKAKSSKWINDNELLKVDLSGRKGLDVFRIADRRLKESINTY